MNKSINTSQPNINNNIPKNKNNTTFTNQNKNNIESYILILIKKIVLNVKLSSIKIIIIVIY